MKVNVSTAKTQLSRLIDLAMAGQEIVITRHGRPVARLIGAEAMPAPRKLGLMRGRIRIGEDFDAPLPEALLQSFEGTK
jgi:prevent-host-death family protein